MQQTERPAQLVRFGVYEVDLRSGELRKNGLKLKLGGQPFQVLALLLERAGDVVTRDEIQKQLWPADTFVDFDHGLNTAINKIRDVLRDSADSPRFVETLPRRGYRFIAPVGVGPDGKRPADDHLSVVAMPAPRVNIRWALRAGGALATLSALAIVWFVRHRASPRPELTEQRLTFNSPDNQVWSAAISPNGKYLAYSDLTGVWLRLIETGQTQRLFSIKEGAGINRLAWFPDSARLLATGNTDPEDGSNIWVTSVLGEAPRTLRADAEVATVSPDGTQIAFVSGEDFHALWVMGARGEGQHRIGVYGDSSIEMPVWSPDGRRIAYFRIDEGPATIESRDLNGGPAVPIVSDPRLRIHKGGLVGASLCWSPDGRIIYPMSTSQKTGETDLWALRVDSLTGKPYGKPDRITSWGGSFFIGVDVTADGKRLLALRAHAQSDVWVGDIQEQATGLEAPRRLTVEDSDDQPSAWTPEGKAVLFSSDRDGRSHIFRQALGETRAEAVTAGPEDDFRPVVTPNAWILYEMAPSNEVFRRQPLRLMRFPASGGAPDFVTDLQPDSTVRCMRTVRLWSSQLSGRVWN